MRSFEQLLNEIDNVSIKDEYKITMNEARAIIEHDDKSNYSCINDAFKLGYLVAQQEYSLDENLFKLSEDVAECDLATDKAKLIVGDILNKYSFLPGGSLEEKSRKSLSIDADRVMTYLFIALDYIASTHERLKIMQDSIELNITERKVQS